MALEPIAAKWVRAISISTAIAAAAYLTTVLWVGRSQVAAALKLISVETLIGLVGLSVTNYALRFLRWHYYIRKLGSTISIRHNFRIYIAGFALTTTPGKAGEMARSLWLRPYGVPVKLSVAAFFAERLQDFIAVLLLACFGATLYPHGIWLLSISLGVLLVGLVVLFVPSISHAAENWVIVHRAQSTALARRLSDILDHTRMCLTPGRFCAGLVVGLFAWGAEAWAFSILLQAMGHSLGMVIPLAIFSLSMLAGAVSFMPGGLGGSEATMLVLLRLYGTPLPIAVAATLLIQLTTLWFAVLLGIIALLIRVKIPPQSSLAPGSSTQPHSG